MFMLILLLEDKHSKLKVVICIVTRLATKTVEILAFWYKTKRSAKKETHDVMMMKILILPMV